MTENETTLKTININIEGLDEEEKEKVIAQAQERMKSRGGPQLKEAVWHPSGYPKYSVDKILNGTASVSRSGATGVITKDFPVNELYSLTDAEEIANGLKKTKE